MSSLSDEDDAAAGDGDMARDVTMDTLAEYTEMLAHKRLVSNVRENLSALCQVATPHNEPAVEREAKLCAESEGRGGGRNIRR